MKNKIAAIALILISFLNMNVAHAEPILKDIPPGSKLILKKDLSYHIEDNRAWAVELADADLKCNLVLNYDSPLRKEAPTRFVIKKGTVFEIKRVWSGSEVNSMYAAREEEVEDITDPNVCTVEIVNGRSRCKHEYRVYPAQAATPADYANTLKVMFTSTKIEYLWCGEISEDETDMGEQTIASFKEKFADFFDLTLAKTRVLEP